MMSPFLGLDKSKDIQALKSFIQLPPVLAKVARYEHPAELFVIEQPCVDRLGIACIYTLTAAYPWGAFYIRAISTVHTVPELLVRLEEMKVAAIAASLSKERRPIVRTLISIDPVSLTRRALPREATFNSVSMVQQD